jgi:hypothetical protein
LILIFTNILKTKTGNTYYFLYDQGYMLLDNDFYILVKRHLIPHNSPNMKKVFLTFAVTFIIAILALLFFTMMPQWTSDDDVLLSEFSTERALESKGNFETTALCWFSKSQSGC